MTMARFSSHGHDHNYAPLAVLSSGGLMHRRLDVWVDLRLVSAALASKFGTHFARIQQIQRIHCGNVSRSRELHIMADLRATTHSSA